MYLLRLLAAGALALALMLFSPLRLLGRAVGLVVRVIGFALVAGAAQAATVDIGPLVSEIVIPAVVALLGLLATWLARKAVGWFGMQQDGRATELLEAAMKNGLAYAQAQLAGRIGTGPIAIEVRSEAVAIAANYAVTHVPDALKLLGVDRGKLVDKLTARLALNTTPPGQSIAVPTLPAAAGAD